MGKIIRVPRAAINSPVTLLHSPPKPIDPTEAANWKIPPAISNWKNAKGFIIPLDKRLAADGRALQETKINDKFSKLSEALYIAEQKAREDTELRNRIARQLALREKEIKDAEMRALAIRARIEKMGGCTIDLSSSNSKTNKNTDKTEKTALVKDNLPKAIIKNSTANGSEKFMKKNSLKH